MSFKKSLICPLTVVIFTSFQSIAACPQPVQLLEKGKITNCTGFLYSPEAEAKSAQDHADAIYYKEYSNKLEKRKELTEKQIQILDKRLDLYIQQSETLAEQLYKRESQNKWERVIWFSLGVLTAGLAVHGASRL